MNYFENKEADEIIVDIMSSIAVAFLNALIVMLLWNYVAVTLFALPRIGYWMAFCLRWLCSILFNKKQG